MKSLMYIVYSQGYYYIINLLDKINARVPDIKAFTERNAKAFKTIGIITDDLSFKAKSRGSAIFFILELLESEIKQKKIIKC